jgi:hypothetical protein
VKDPNVSIFVGDRREPITATVDTGSPISFFSSDAIRAPSGARRGRYMMGGRTWKGHFAPLRIRIAEGCELTTDAFIAPKATFNVVGTDVLQGLGCRINLKSHKLTCPPAKNVKGCSIPMFNPEARYEPTGKTGRARKAPKRRR